MKDLYSKDQITIINTVDLGDTMHQHFSVASRLSQLNLGVYYYAHKRGTLESILGYIVLFFFRHSMFPETQNLARSMFSLFSCGG